MCRCGWRGENNAFTSTDITNYYETLPSQNLETAFWLESDRMNELAFSEQSLEVQRKVVVEEFKEHYINQPYGDVWHKLRELAYTTSLPLGLPSASSPNTSSRRSLMM